MVILERADPPSRALVHSLATQWEVALNVDLSTKILPKAELERLRNGPERFWRHFDRDELILWPTTSPHA